jgi:hypothetical protein
MMLRAADGPEWISDQKVGRYRAMAHECRACSERARYELDKQAWLKLSDDWNALAESALQRRPDGVSLTEPPLSELARFILQAPPEVDGGEKTDQSHT